MSLKSSVVLRKLFVKGKSVVQHEYALKQTKQARDEKVDLYIKRKSKEVLARLPLKEYPLEKHLTLVAWGIYDYELQKELLEEALDEKVTMNSFIQRALKHEAVNWSQTDIKRTRQDEAKLINSTSAFPSRKYDSQRTSSTDKVNAMDSRRKPGQCWHCNEPGHLRQDCAAYKEHQRKIGRTDREIVRQLYLDWQDDADLENYSPPDLTSADKRE